MLPTNADSIVDSAEARQLPALIAEWEPADDERAWLARALRVDLALLTELPHLALPGLERRCSQDRVWFAQAPEVPLHAARAATLSEGWAAARSGRCLRAVRPPSVPLCAGVVEEYRTSLLGELCVSSDGLQLGVLGEAGTISWDRTSGRRTDRAASAAASGAWAPLLPPILGRAWSVARANSWGSLALVASDGVEVTIEIGGVIGRAAHALDDDHAIVDCDDAEGVRRHCLVHVPGRRLVWIADGDCRAAVLSGAEVICGGSRGVSVRTLGSGALRGGWPGPPVDALVAVRGGAIVTRSGAVIRVWDRAAAGAELAGTYGWTSAQFSPAGDRLVTGGNLCDARTGAYIARMQVNGPGWLEGGPPIPCQALVAGAFVEIQPMGLRVWDAADGHVRVEDTMQGARHDDDVAFDPTGRVYALARRSTGYITIRSLAGGTTLASHSVRLARGEAVGFTADGERLWWRADDGSRWIVWLRAGAQPSRIADTEPTPAIVPPKPIAVRDGLLVVGELAVPCDDAEVIASPDGRAFASRHSHYVVSGS